MLLLAAEVDCSSIYARQPQGANYLNKSCYAAESASD